MLIDRRELFKIIAAAPLVALDMESEDLVGCNNGEHAESLVAGKTIKVIGGRATLAEGKPNGKWRRFTATGVIVHGLDGTNYWHGTDSEVWEKCE